MFAEGLTPMTEAVREGDMARLIDAHDWDSSPLGRPAAWPRALQTTVDLMLASQFPMFVAWGAERCMVYNDAYARVLGKKHPGALGAPFRLAWNDIWHEVGPIADRAFANQPSYFKDLPIQMERNGYPELTYFTFSYSGVHGDSGTIEGMFCVCQETTTAVIAEAQRVSEMERMRQLFQQAPGFMAMLRGPEHVFEMANTSYLKVTGVADLVGKPIRATMPELAGQGIFELLDQVYATGQPYVARGMAVKVRREPDGGLEDIFVNFVYQPIVAADGAVSGIFVEGSEVTEQFLAQQNLARNLERLEAVERRQAFQLELADSIRDLDEPEDITAAASGILGRRLGVDRVVYAEIDDEAGTFVVTRQWLAGGVARVPEGPRGLDDFGPRLIAELRSGKTMAIGDVRTDPNTAAQADAFMAIGVIANLGVPLVKAGRLVAVLNLHQHVPRDWTGDIELARETAERTWAALQSARARAELKAERDQGQHILKNMIEGFALLDARGRVLQINAEALAIGGREEHEVLGRQHLEVWPQAAGGALGELFGRVMRSGAAATVEYAHRFPDGREVWLEVRCHPWVAGGLAVFLRDVSERKRFEESLRASERGARLAAEQAETERRLLDALLDAAPVGIVMADVDGRLVRVNRANRRLWGETLPTRSEAGQHAEWKGWWADGSARHGQPLAAGEWALARVLRGEEAPHDVVTIEPFGAPGMRRTIVLSAAAVRDGQGRIAGGVVAQMDITAREAAERALRDSEAKFRTITNAMPHMVFSTLPDGNHDYFNQQWYEFTGVAEGATAGERWAEVFHPDDQAPAWQAWRHSLATGAPYEIEYRLRHHSGQYRWVLARALPIRNEGGAIVRWMGSATDIHDQKLTQEALRLADRRKDEFLAMLAHELRNPLAPISAGADLLRLTRVDEARVRQISELISRQVKHMTSLVDDLMDVSRVTRGLVTPDKATLDARHIVSHAVEQVRPLIDGRGHQLAVHTPPESAFVLGDQKRLIQVITNLLNNAAKYTPHGGSIALRMDTTPAEVVVSVTDNGIGMGPEMVGRVFELFTQAERTSDRSQGGLGIGLALVKSLVELHDGSVTAASAGLERGSEFTIRLPRVAMPAPPLAAADAQLLVPAGAALRVLVVDDNQDAAMVLAMFLQTAGHEVAVEHSARRALERARSDGPDVCLLDIGLPDLDGNELARRLRAQPGGAGRVLVAVTGYGQEQDRRETAAAGFDHHFVKPVDAEALLALLAGLKRR